MKRLAAAALLALSAGATAQVPPDMAEAIRASEEMDPTIGRIYAPLFPASAWEGVEVERDIAYDADPLQRLDVYAPETGGEPHPVLLFVHGGGFTRGDKHGEFYPDNVTLWAAKEGMVGVGINYRLAPASPWPAGAEDLAAAIAWTRANIARFGGDPNRIVLFGHSAGANHVADYIGNPAVQGPEAAVIRGAVLLSPFYPEGQDDGDPHVYYGKDQDLNSTSGSVRRLAASSIPLFLADAELDPVGMRTYAANLRDGLCRTASRCPRYLRLADHNHFTEGMSLGTADRSLSGPLLAWMRALPPVTAPPTGEIAQQP